MNSHKHLKRRSRQRFGFKIKKKDRKYIINKIKKGILQPVSTSGTRGVFIITRNNIDIKIVYDYHDDR